MNGLLIAPSQAGISWAGEIRDITDDHNFDVLTGEVDRQQVINAIEGETYDLIHVAAHGGIAGVALGGKNVLTTADLVMIAKQTRARAVFLNACSTARPAQSLIDAGVPIVIAFTDEIMDQSAWDIARLFYGALASGDDMGRAYDVANPRNGSLIWLQQRTAAANAQIDSLKRHVLFMWSIIVVNLLINIGVLISLIK